MEQTTQYLYEYQDGKRIRNIGFMKIEQQMDKCVIQIHARQMDEVTGIIFQKANKEKYVGAWNQELLDIEERPQIPQEQVAVSEMKEVDVEEYIQPSNIIYEKIQRQDISRFPRKEWRIANNSFLLHGYYNYHHLLYIEENDNIWLGVPGIYHEKEQMAANAFGFSEFRRLTDAEIKLEENEKNTYEDFGYWCRQMRKADDESR